MAAANYAPLTSLEVRRAICRSSLPAVFAICAASTVTNKLVAPQLYDLHPSQSRVAMCRVHSDNRTTREPPPVNVICIHDPYRPTITRPVEDGGRRFSGCYDALHASSSSRAPRRLSLCDVVQQDVSSARRHHDAGCHVLCTPPHPI